MTTETTIETITTEQIEALRDEAGAAGDQEMVEICDRALATVNRWGLLDENSADVAECVEIIREAGGPVSTWKEDASGWAFTYLRDLPAEPAGTDHPLYQTQAGCTLYEVTKGDDNVPTGAILAFDDNGPWARVWVEVIREAAAQ